MKTTKHPNKTTALVADQKAIAGVEKYFGGASKLTLLGTDYTPVALEAAFQAEVDALNALDAAKAQLKQQVAETHGVRGNARALRAALKKFILGAYGPTAVQMLEDFGMSVPKAMGPKTAEAKAEAVVKGRGTKEAKKHALESVHAGGSPLPNATPQK